MYTIVYIYVVVYMEDRGGASASTLRTENGAPEGRT
jgi:hypothetical protein